MRIIFSGAIGRLPLGGHAWIQMQYLAGLRALGHEVVYMEDCGEESWVYNWDTQELTTKVDYPAAYVRQCMDLIGAGTEWFYRAGDEPAGMPLAQFRAFCASADLLLVWAVPLTVWRPEYDLPRRRAFIDADPGFTQISLVTGHADLRLNVERCESLFTVGQRFGAADCPIPDAGRRWHKTVAPVGLQHWPYAEAPGSNYFSAVMQWRGFREVSYNGVCYGQKDREFPKFIELPRLTSQPLQLALTGASPERMIAHGWNVIEGWITSKTAASYRSFIQESRAEFGVAKHGYVAMRSGWFSDRSVCYLASGRPVVVEDTGIGDWLPVGEGILTFRDLDGAVRGIETINADYERHRAAARRIAEEFFSSDRVLPPMLDVAMS